MQNKKCRLFLWVSFAIFALTVIAVVLSWVVEYYEVKATFPNDPTMAMNEFSYALIVSMCIIIPFLGTELSFIRSVYKISKQKPKGCVKICYMISSCLAFLALVFLYLSSIGLISFVDEDGYNYMAEILLFTQWSIFILSFVLGSIPIKQDD